MSFFRGLLFALPASLAMWAAIIFIAWVLVS